MCSFVSAYWVFLRLLLLRYCLSMSPTRFYTHRRVRLLAEFMAKERRLGSQLFVATHNVDFLLGLLDAAPTH